MVNKVYRLVVVMLLMSLQGLAQDVEMADSLRSSGKIYVVVAVLVVIFLGLAFYLFNLDRKMSKIEKKINP